MHICMYACMYVCMYVMESCEMIHTYILYKVENTCTSIRTLRNTKITCFIYIVSYIHIGIASTGMGGLHIGS